MYRYSGPSAIAAARIRVSTVWGSSGSASSITVAVGVPVSALGGTAASAGSTELASMRRPLPTGAAAMSSAVPGSAVCPPLITTPSTVADAAVSEAALGVRYTLAAGFCAVGADSGRHPRPGSLVVSEDSDADRLATVQRPHLCTLSSVRRRRYTGTLPCSSPSSAHKTASGGTGPLKAAGVRVRDRTRTPDDFPTG